jgi:LysM repeat protein
VRLDSSRRELVLGVLGLLILGAVAYVLFAQATEGDGIGLQSETATPTPESTTSPTPSPTPTPAATPTPTPAPQTYTVQPGDTLLGIAERFGITVEDLQAKNELADPNNIFAGQKLELPQPGERVQPETPAAGGGDSEDVYVVKAGDTLYAISQELEVTVEDLAEINEITDADELFVGRRLLIPERRLTPPTVRPAAGAGQSGAST